VIELGLIQGKGAKWMQKELEKSLDITKKKAEDIARTETSSALNAAAEQRYAAAGITKVQLLITPSQNVCPYCAARNGAVFDLGKLKVPLHVRCLLPGTVVSSPGANAGTSRQYDGPVVSIKTARGEELTVTPNHPILTDKGWIAAGLVNKSHHVFSSVDGERITNAIAPDKYNAPTLIEEVLASLGVLSCMVSSSMEGTAEDFHGDGIPNSKVSVVHPNSFLFDKGNPKAGQHVCHNCFMPAARDARTLLPFSHSALNIKGNRHIPARIMSRLHLVRALFNRHLAPLQRLSLALASQGDIRALKNVLNSSAANIKLLGKLENAAARLVHGANAFPYGGISHLESISEFGSDQSTMLSNSSRNASHFDFMAESMGVELESTRSIFDRLPGQVHIDRVIETSVKHYSGLVHNIETKTGWYFANNIITHNCRCMILPWDEAWADAGLVDEKFVIDYHKKGISELRKNGLEPDYSGAAPFERANKLPIPKTAWTPRGREAEKPRETKPTKATKTTKPAKEKTTRKPRKATAAKVKEIKTATKPQRDLPPVVTMTNPKTPSEMATLGRQTYAKEYQAIQSVKPVSSALKAAEAKALDLVRMNPGDESAKESYKIAARAYRKDQVRYGRDRISAFADLREKMKSRGDRLSAQAWADSIEIDEGVVKLYGSNRIKEILTDFHMISRGKVDNIDAIVYRDFVHKGQVLMPKERGYAQKEGRIVNTGNHTAEEIASTLFHEMGHHVEYGDLPGVTRYGSLAREWRDERVTSMNQMSLREITGIQEYSENELARPGSFFNPYLGKVYKGGSTEVIAMGMEHLDTPVSMAALYDKQPDLFDFVIGITAHD
jgi:SPP1 gp7 family putative phage head morphogenesis protein